MSEEHKFDKVYHTQDGKTVYVNAETNQAQIFDGTLSVEAVQAPQGEATVAGQGVANQEQIFEALKHIYCRPLELLGSSNWTLSW